MTTFEATIHGRRGSNLGKPLLTVSKLAAESYQIEVLEGTITKSELVESLQQVIELLEGDYI